LYRHLSEILGEHTFWKNQPIVQPLQKMKKIGQIKNIDPKEVPEEPIALPEGFMWSDFDPENEE
jgi:hypothetical protein